MGGGIGTSPLPTKAATDSADTALIATQSAEAIVAIDDSTVEPTDVQQEAPTTTDELAQDSTSTDAPTATHTETEIPTITPTITQTPTVTFTPTITDTATAYPMIDELPSGVAVSLHYNQIQVAIRNDSDGAVVFSEMRLSGSDDDGIGEFDGATLPVIALLSGECIVVRSETDPVPEEWECTKVRSSIELQTPARFWFADNSDDTDFHVFWRSNEIKTCNTVGRAVARTEVLCQIEWPILADG
jgi:hypothetical protein